MDTNVVYTFAKWQVREGRLDEVLNILAELSLKSMAEDGNLEYTIHQSTSDPNTLVLFEAYKDEAALAEHRKSQHYQALIVEKILPLLQDREIVVTTRL